MPLSRISFNLRAHRAKAARTDQMQTPDCTNMMLPRHHLGTTVQPDAPSSANSPICQNNKVTGTKQQLRDEDNKFEPRLKTNIRHDLAGDNTFETWVAHNEESKKRQESWGWFRKPVLENKEIEAWNFTICFVMT